MPFLTVADLQVFKPDIDAAKAEAMIEDASAMASSVAPCITSATDPRVVASVKAVLRSAILRWEDSGSGAMTMKQETIGPYTYQDTYDTRSRRSGLFWPDEITTLQGLCNAGTSKAFSIDTMPPVVEVP